MNLEGFEESLGAGAPPADLAPALQALWHAAAGNWHRAHELVQAEDGDDDAWVHAYLHRAEGDQANAGYWYRRAGKPHATESLEAEWRAIARTLLEEA